MNGKVKKIINDRMWGNQEAASLAADLARILAEYRVYGDVEIIPSTLHHRHSGQWDCGRSTVDRGLRG